MKTFFISPILFHRFCMPSTDKGIMELIFTTDYLSLLPYFHFRLPFCLSFFIQTIRPSSIHFSVFLSIWPPIHLSTHQSIYLSTHLSAHLSNCIYLPLSISIHPSIYLATLSISTHLSIYLTTLSIYLPTYLPLSVYLSTYLSI